MFQMLCQRHARLDCVYHKMLRSHLAQKTCHATLGFSQTHFCARVNSASSSLEHRVRSTNIIYCGMRGRPVLEEVLEFVVVGGEPARCASIPTTTRATLMLLTLLENNRRLSHPLYFSWNRHGTVLSRSSCSGCLPGLARAY
jgi:hypothetical protein